MKAIILHNLAIVNYCEISDHNDRVLSGENAEDEDRLLEQIEKKELEKKAEKQEQLRIRAEVDKERRLKHFRDRQHSLNERLSKQLKGLRSDFVFSKNKAANRIE